MRYDSSNMSDHTDRTIDRRLLREKVYDYIKSEMHNGQLLPGSNIKLKEISKKLSVSKTPLRDAVIQLECEGFVSILPRRGVRVTKLNIEDIRNILEIIGSLEGALIETVGHKLTEKHLLSMRKLNSEMIHAIHKQDYDRYYKHNINFHNVFLRVSGNDTAHRIIMPMKQRLYDFPKRTYIKEWELMNCQEHTQLIQYLERGNHNKAASLMRDSHWSYEAYEKFIKYFYFNTNERKP